MKLNAEIESRKQLSFLEVVQLVDAAIAAKNWPSIDYAYNTLTGWFPSSTSGFLIFRGGSHVAVHHRNNPDLRLLIICEVKR